MYPDLDYDRLQDDARLSDPVSPKLSRYPLGAVRQRAIRVRVLVVQASFPCLEVEERDGPG